MKHSLSFKSFLSAFVFVAVLACSPALADDLPVKPENPKWKITIPGKSGSLCNSPTYIAYEKGFFAEEGIDATLVAADFETAKVGLNNGTIATANGDFQFFPAIESNIGLTVIAGLHEGCIKLNVLPDSDIHGVKDLKGKKIAVDEIGGTTYQAALLWLAQGGLGLNDVTFLPYSDSNLELQALYSGQIDVAALWDPQAAQSIKAGKSRAILDIAEDEPFKNHYCCYLYASTKLIKEQPELIAAELRAYDKAKAWINANPEETVKVVTEKQYVAVEDYDLAVELVKSYHYSSNADAGKDVEYFARALHDVGYLQSDPEEYVKKAFTAIDTTK